MTTVANGIRYNTETATKVAYWSFGNHGDFKRCQETLYRTKNGRYFLHGRGGPLSPYAEQVGQNEWGGGATIQPMSPNEALEWLETRDYDVPQGCPEIEALLIEG